MISQIRYYSNKSCENCVRENKLCHLNNILRDPIDAQNNLYLSFGELIKSFQSLPLDILLNGSNITNSLMKEPIKKLLDYKSILYIYIKDVNIQKIFNINKKIYQTYSTNKIIILRETEKIIWLICDDKYNTLLQINLSTLIYNSWKDLFESITIDIYLSGFSTKTNKFIVDKVYWYNAINYYTRIHLNKDGPLDDKNFEISQDNYYNFSDYKNLPNIENVFITDNIKTILKKIKTFADCKKIGEKTIRKLSKEISNMRVKEGNYCCIILQDTNMLMANKLCPHDISALSYLISKIKICPYCRKKFAPRFYNSSREKRPNYT